MSNEFSVPVDRIVERRQGQDDYEHLVWQCYGMLDVDDPATCARRFLDYFPHPADARLMSKHDVNHMRLIGPAGVEKVLPLIQLGLCIARTPRPMLGRAYSSHELGAELTSRYAGYEAECVEVVLLDVHNEIIAYEPLFIGGFSECPVYSSRVFQLAVKFGAQGIVLAHNHPTGKWQPSKADLQFCQKLRRAAGLLNLDLIDFLVIGSCGYYSWRENTPDVQGPAAMQTRIG